MTPWREHVRWAVALSGRVSAAHSCSACPLCSLSLSGLYYLYAKYTERAVHAFAIIWLVFVVLLVGGMLIGWRRREAEAKIARAQFEQDEREKEQAMERKNHKLEVSAQEERKHN